MAARTMAIILLLCLCLTWVPGTALAVSTSDALEPISPDQPCFLTLNYTCTQVPFPGLTVKLYHIAQVSADARYSLTPEFQSSGLELNGIQTNAEWDIIRSTLEAHILANGVEADYTAVTGEDGRVCFADLAPGMYLAASVYAEQNDWRCSFRSCLIALPGLDDRGHWQYDMEVSPKPEILPPAEPEAQQFQVLKLWKDAGNEQKRPVSIQVEIFRDGESYGVVTLSEENNWTYRWTVPADGARWMVVERNIPEGYTLTVEERTTTFILTNSIPKDPPENPKTGDSVNILLAVVVLQLSGAALIALGLFRKRFEQ